MKKLRLKSPARFAAFLMVIVFTITATVVAATRKSQDCTTMVEEHVVAVAPVAESVVIAEEVMEEVTEPVSEPEEVSGTVVDEAVEEKKPEIEVSRGGDRSTHTYDEEERYYLAKVIHCEAGIDSFSGKLAVGNVVLNRAKHPNQNLYGGPTIKGVALHKLPGATRHQFSCVDDETLWAEEPTEEDYMAADKLLSGYRVFRDTFLYYYNPDLSKGIKGIECTYRVGMHLFGEE